VILGGGQEAMGVTMTAAQQGKFETLFFHMVRISRRSSCLFDLTTTTNTGV
jgi:hypothetical protein